MFDFGWSEMAVIAVVALVVIGPKDLPRVLRTAGQWAAKARSMAREFQNSLEDMAREAELDDLKKEVDKVTSIDFNEEVAKTVDPDGELQQSLQDMNSIADGSSASATESAAGEPATLEAAAAELAKPDSVETVALPPAAEPQTAVADPAPTSPAAAPAVVADEPEVVPVVPKTGTGA